MYELNHGGDFNKAVDYFHAAYHFYSFLESIALCLGDFQLQSRFHEGLALLRAQKCQEAVAVFDDMGKLAAKFPNGLADRVRWERAVTRLRMGDETGAISDFAAIALEQFDFIKPGMRAPMQLLLKAGLKRVDALQGRLLDDSRRVVGLVSKAADEMHAMAPKVRTRLERMDELVNRGHAFADAVEDEVDAGVARLDDYARQGSQWSVQFRAQLQAESLRVNKLIDGSYDISKKLEAALACADRADWVSWPIAAWNFRYEGRKRARQSWRAQT